MSLTNDELETMVRRLDDALTFVMVTMKVRATLNSGLTGLDGRPLPGVTQDMTMLQMYQEQVRALAAQQAITTPPVDDKLVKEV